MSIQGIILTPVQSADALTIFSQTMSNLESKNSISTMISSNTLGMISSLLVKIVELSSPTSLTSIFRCLSMSVAGTMYLKNSFLWSFVKLIFSSVVSFAVSQSLSTTNACGKRSRIQLSSDHITCNLRGT